MNSVVFNPNSRQGCEKCHSMTIIVCVCVCECASKFPLAVRTLVILDVAHPSEPLIITEHLYKDSIPQYVSF